MTFEQSPENEGGSHVTDTYRATEESFFVRNGKCEDPNAGVSLAGFRSWQESQSADTQWAWREGGCTCKDFGFYSEQGATGRSWDKKCHDLTRVPFGCYGKKSLKWPKDTERDQVRGGHRIRSKRSSLKVMRSAQFWIYFENRATGFANG